MKITASILPTTIIAVTVVLFCFTTEQQHQHRFVSASFRGAVKNNHDQNGNGNDELFLGLGLARPTGRALQIKCKDHVKGGPCKNDTRCKWSAPKGKKKTCKNKPKTCEQTTKKTKCKQMNKKCHWTSGQPMCRTFSGECSDWDYKEGCRAHSCAWKKKRSSCVKKTDPKCSTLTGVEKCDGKKNRCKWLTDTTKCVNKDDGKGYGCYFMNDHKCHCNPYVCTESKCATQDKNKPHDHTDHNHDKYDPNHTSHGTHDGVSGGGDVHHLHLWTEGCGSCRCPCSSGSYDSDDCKI